MYSFRVRKDVAWIWQPYCRLQGGVFLLFLFLAIAGGDLHAQIQKPITSDNSIFIPAGSSFGLYANLWAERYVGSTTPRFKPAKYLEPNTNYLFILELSAISYTDAEFAVDGVVSIPLPQLRYQLEKRWKNNRTIISHLVIEDEKYHPEKRPYFFSLHDLRGRVIRNVELVNQLDAFRDSNMTPVASDAFSLVKIQINYPSSPYVGPPGVLERHVFFLQVRNRTGYAPLGIAFRDWNQDWDPAKYNPNDKVIGVISTKFCVEYSKSAQNCEGYPRESEQMGYEISNDPPKSPSYDDVVEKDYEKGNGIKPPTWTWNSWISRQGDSNKNAVDTLILDDHPVQSTYNLQIDASLYKYSKTVPKLEKIVGHAEADKYLLELVKHRISENDTNLQLVVRAQEIGDSVEIIGGRLQKVEVDLTKLNPDKPPKLPTSVTTISIKSLSDLTSAGSIKLQLKPKAPGPGAIALSILDVTGTRPLDHLVHYLSVSKSSVHTESLESDRQSTSLHSGLRTLLTHEGAPKVDAAIHLFTVFSDGHLNSSAAAFIYGVSDKPISWELSRPAKEYLKDSKNLEKRILEARERTIDGVKHAYDRAAHELASAIFSGRNPTEQDRADEALNALKSFAKNSLKPPKLLVRATDMFEHDMFMPLGLLSAKGEYAVLEKPVNILLPLPVEDYGESGCIDKWVVAVSDTLEGAEVTVPEEIKQDKSWLGESFDALRRYLTKKERSQKEMLLIVAHHSDGQLRYGENDFQLLADQIKRNYGNSTAAVLAMCKAGGVSSGSSHLIRRLNEFGLDAAIISPFPLDANYGKAFAIEFYRVVKEAQTSGRPDTLEQLFNAAVSATANKMKNHPNPKVKGSIGDMGLELILVGNQTLRLCN